MVLVGRVVLVKMSMMSFIIRRRRINSISSTGPGVGAENAEMEHPELPPMLKPEEVTMMIPPPETMII